MGVRESPCAAGAAGAGATSGRPAGGTSAMSAGLGPRFADRPGDHVRKPTWGCTGEEVARERLHHFGVPVEKISEVVRHPQADGGRRQPARRC
ncbi:oleate hydratase [Kitasatospora sp. RG8]|uniref:oleate hydratase n=1 Tax=Kitasatospora sp. RG8 TaxID=2820815 RepID=UPI001AE02656|nr:oleate hydratase [Kitasatospora sp. RG8]MBP0454265.1 oleate hydratase [Kitasatospora sp. RG8]